MAGLFELLKKIQDIPGLYIGSPSVTELRLFLVGCRFARGEMGLTSTDEEIDFYRNWLGATLVVTAQPLALPSIDRGGAIGASLL